MAELTKEDEKKNWLYNAALDMKKSAATESELNELIRQLKELVPYKDTEALLQEAEDTLKREQSYQTALEAETRFQSDYEDNDYDEDDLRDLIRSFELLGDYKDANAHMTKAKDLQNGMHAAQSKKKMIKIAVLAAVLMVGAVLVWHEMQASRGAFTELISRAEQGDILVQHQLGNMYYNGEGVNVDYKEAARWYKMAADQGYAQAQFNLGEMYYNNQGVEKGVPQAVELYRKAAVQGHVRAQYKLGGAYYNGWGVKQDYKLALKWFRKSARRGNAEAQTAVGNIYYNGTGVRRNYSEAVVWYRCAAEQGYSWAQYYLGNMYRNGLGITKDLQQARELYKKAAEQGHLGAMRALEHIKGL
ncbi:MAG: sel1 repeat family protein [Fretibacterium sp.]|nr:sel1 repeat family protein [Fretibacterium sp.]